jgi:hypothetical protein
MFAPPKTAIEQKKEERLRAEVPNSEEHWRWRMQMAERIAGSVGTVWPGVKAMYVLGSAKNATARAHSDIDLLIHFDGDEAEGASLEKWLDGWSLALNEMNFLRTGFRCGRLLDVYFVSSDEISRREGMAAKIGAITDAARPLKLG